MKAKDRYSAEGLMAHRQRVMAGANAEAVKRKSENAKAIAAVTRRLKQGTRADVTPFPYFGVNYARGGRPSVAASWIKDLCAQADSEVLRVCGISAGCVFLDDILVRP